MKKVLKILICLTLLIGSGLYAADFAVPELELITRGYIEDNAFLLATRGSMEFLIAGGYKFGGRIRLGFESNNLEDLDADRSIQLKGARVIMQDPFGIPFSLAYFTGDSDVFGTGEVFPTYFGARTIASKFSGYLYFPDPDQVQYDGIHTVSGTGIQISSGFNTDALISSLYIYQDSYLGTGTYSLDIYTALNTMQFKLEAFVGGSYPASTYGFYRGGLLLFYDTGQGGEFLTQIGIPRWDPVNDPFAIDLFYFLFEPRVRFGFFAIILTLFWHPQYYLQTVTEELGSADINANFQFGNPDTSQMSGGIEAKIGFSTTSSQQFQAVISPYFSTITSGIIWDFKVNAQLFPFSLATLAQIFIGVRAEF